MSFSFLVVPKNPSCYKIIKKKQTTNKKVMKIRTIYNYGIIFPIQK